MGEHFKRIKGFKKEIGMKTKPIPESWHIFHRLVIIHSHNPKWSLNRCVAEAGCSARMPRIYTALGWIKPQREPCKWKLNVPSINMTTEMAEQIREQSKRMETASDPLGVKIKEWKKGIATMTSEEIATFRIEEQMGWKDAKPIETFTDDELVSELRRRGVDVKAKKLVEL